VPKGLSGEFTVLPRIDTGPIESKILPRTIRIANGKWVRDEQKQANE